MIERTISTALRPLARRIENILARALVTAVSGGRLQVLQVSILDGEVKDGVQHYEPAGFTSHPVSGAEALVLFPDGIRTHAIAAVVTDRRCRPADLQPGEAAVFCPGDGLAQIRAERDGTIRIRGKRIVLEADGDIALTASGQLLEESREHKVLTGIYAAARKV